MVSKWVGDAFGKEGIYASWIAMRRYLWLSNEEYRDKAACMFDCDRQVRTNEVSEDSGETAATLMRRADELVVIRDRQCTLGELGERTTRLSLEEECSVP